MNDAKLLLPLPIFCSPLKVSESGDVSSPRKPKRSSYVRQVRLKLMCKTIPIYRIDRRFNKLAFLLFGALKYVGHHVGSTVQRFLSGFSKVNISANSRESFTCT